MDFDKINQDLLEKLIGEKNEYEELDYKETLDINSTKGVVFLVKDIIAMANMEKGGYIVLGVNNDYIGIGLGSDFHIDEALLNSKINSYCNPNVYFIYKEMIRDVDSKKYAIIFVKPSEYPVMPKKQGQFSFENRNGSRTTQLEFNKGDIFYRKGSSSVKTEDFTEIQQILKHKEIFPDKEGTRLVDSELDDLSADEVDHLEKQLEKMPKQPSFSKIEIKDQDIEIWRKIEGLSDLKPSSTVQFGAQERLKDVGIIPRDEEEILLSYMNKNAIILIEGYAGIGKTLLLVRLIKKWFEYWKEESIVINVQDEQSYLASADVDSHFSEKWTVNDTEKILELTATGKKF